MIVPRNQPSHRIATDSPPADSPPADRLPADTGLLFHLFHYNLPESGAIIIIIII